MILPLFLCIEAVLRYIEEFDNIFGFVVIGVAGYLLYCFGINVPAILAIMAALINIPTLMNGVSLGTCLWVMQLFMGKPGWLSVLSEWDIGWIVLVLFAKHIISLCVWWELEHTSLFADLVLIIICVSPYLMSIAGVILLLLEHFGIIIIPEIINNIHLIETGIGIFCAQMLIFWIDGRLLDESVDK